MQTKPKARDLHADADMVHIQAKRALTDAGFAIYLLGAQDAYREFQASMIQAGHVLAAARADTLEDMRAGNVLSEEFVLDVLYNQRQEYHKTRMRAEARLLSALRWSLSNAGLNPALRVHPDTDMGDPT